MSGKTDADFDTPSEFAAYCQGLEDAARIARGRAVEAERMTVIGGGMDYACSLAAALGAKSIADEIDRIRALVSR